WLVPHFEKMLYDNAQLVQLYLDAHLAAKAGGQQPQAQLFADVVHDILEYVLRDMTDAKGGFFSAEDADSEGHEGKFYCWTREELLRLLTPEEFSVATKCFGITPQGNFVDHSHPHPLPGQNVLSLVHPVAANERELLQSAKKKMFTVRSQRIRPQRDDKVLASWNGLMLGAFARASAVLGETKYRQAAEKNLNFIRENLWQPAPQPGHGTTTGTSTVGTLSHRWRDGECDQVQLLEGYAFELDGVLHLYEATLEPAHLDFAIALAEAMLAKFHDPANGGFWQSPADTGDLILRVKDDYDGAEPSGNSVAVLALLKLAAITGRADFREPAEATLQLFAGRLQQQPAGLAYLLQAVDFWLDEPRRVVIAGTGPEKLRELLQAAHSVYQPNKIVLGHRGAVEPFAKTLPVTDQATAYLCTGDACQPPTREPEKVRELLNLTTRA
ncbi:MAG TPA: hypothetical protein VF988_08605, partial [Verrucomicrobiae bacterium]